MASGAVVLAHGGGAPETASVAVPLLVVAGFVVAELRMRRRERHRDPRIDRQSAHLARQDAHLDRQASEP